MSSPPLQWITSLEVFLQKQEELFQLVHNCSGSLLVSGCEVDLLRDVEDVDGIQAVAEWEVEHCVNTAHGNAAQADL